MAHEQLSNLPPLAQEQYLNILLGTLEPRIRDAAVKVVLWLASQHLRDDYATPAQILVWIDDVRICKEKRSKPVSASILPFRRKS